MIEEYEILNSNITSLKETSKDDANNQYMTESLIDVIDFDKVKNRYLGIIKFNKSVTPCSNDALYKYPDNENWAFIEFKNGQNIKNYNLYQKIYDSTIIFTDIIQKTVAYTRTNVDYILVYNAPPIEPTLKIKKSSSFDAISEKFLGFAGREIIKFNLDSFEGYIYRRVHTYTIEQFEEMFVNKYSSQI